MLLRCVCVASDMFVQWSGLGRVQGDKNETLAGQPESFTECLFMSPDIDGNIASQMKLHPRYVSRYVCVLVRT